MRKTLARVASADEREEVDALGTAQVEAVQPTFAGMEVRRPKAMPAFLEGFSLDAGTHVHTPERSSWAGASVPLRPTSPLAKYRLSVAPDGRGVVELKRPMYDGTTTVV